jgi:hypothetical protein
MPVVVSKCYASTEFMPFILILLVRICRLLYCCSFLGCLMFILVWYRLGGKLQGKAIVVAVTPLFKHLWECGGRFLCSTN